MRLTDFLYSDLCADLQLHLSDNTISSTLHKHTLRIMWNVCRINEQVQTVKNVLYTTFQTVHTVSPDEVTLENERFFKGVW